MDGNDNQFTPPVLILRLQQLLQARANAEVLRRFYRATRSTIPARGVGILEIRAAVNHWHTEWAVEQQTIPTETERSVAFALLRETIFEDQMAGVEFLGEELIPWGKVSEQDMGVFERAFDRGGLAHWRLCDMFASKVLKQLLRRNKRVIIGHLGGWLRGRSVWKIRAALLALVEVAHDDRYDGIVFDGCARLSQMGERDGQSAVGTALRAISRYRPDDVLAFLKREDVLLAIDTTTLQKATSEFGKSVHKGLVARRAAFMKRKYGSGSSDRA